MKVVVQRVRRASVVVDGAIVGTCGQGLVLFVGVAGDDDAATVDALAAKVARLRLFPNEAGRFDRSLVDVNGQALVVSQFTLLADTTHGNRPGLSAAAAPEIARPLVERFAATLAAHGVSVQTGVFGAHMDVELVNDGPVTILLG